MYRRPKDVLSYLMRDSNLPKSNLIFLDFIKIYPRKQALPSN